MNIQVEVISQEFVKPSSPTPHHLRHLYFSFFDQLSPKVSLPTLHFYSGESTISNLQKCNLLKKSLPQVLTIFYPLASRVRNDSYAECNDEGFLYVEAKASCKLSDVLEERNPINNNYFTPFQPFEAGDLGGFAQITLFECGGVVISFGICHKLGDASALYTFINTWAAVARGDTKAIMTPTFGHAVTFPPIKMPEFDYGQLVSEGKYATKVFVFDRSSIESLKAKYTISRGNGKHLSSVEAITGYIIGRHLVATQTRKFESRRCMAMHAMDMRSRLEPNLCFGNFAISVVTEAQIDEKDEFCFGVADRIRDSLANFAEYFKENQGKLDQVWEFCQRRMLTLGESEVVSFGFSCLNKFPTYESDFGWGKPLWVGTTPLIAKNSAFLFGTKDGEGIEAWISLIEEDMEKFEAHNNFLSLSGVHSRL